jgi:hypothetical protein
MVCCKKGTDPFLQASGKTRNKDKIVLFKSNKDISSYESGLGSGLEVDSSEQGNVISGTIKGGKFLD